jgi:hypothetical protein
MKIEMTLKKSAVVAIGAMAALCVSYILVVTMPDNIPIEGCGTYSWCYKASASALQVFHGLGAFFTGIATIGFSIGAFVMWLDDK